MWILQSLTPWTGPVERFSRSGAKNFKNMSPKMHHVKIFSEKDGPRPGFRIEPNTQISRLLVSDSSVLSVDLYPVFPPVA
jgi:hypothetical protein